MNTATSIHAFLREHPDLRQQLLETTDRTELSDIAWDSRYLASAFAHLHGGLPWERLHAETRGTILHCFAGNQGISAEDAAMMWLRKFRPAGWQKLKSGMVCADATLETVNLILGTELSTDGLKELVQKHSRGTLPPETPPITGNTPETMSNPAPTFEMRPFAEGEDLSQASPNRLLQLVKAHKADIAQLKEVGVTSTFIDAKIAKKEELIAQIVGILDTKESE